MIDMEVKNKKDMEIFYKKALKKILNFKASELSTEEFSKIKLVDIKFGGIQDCAVLIIYEEIQKLDYMTISILETVGKMFNYKEER